MWGGDPCGRPWVGRGTCASPTHGRPQGSHHPPQPLPPLRRSPRPKPFRRSSVDAYWVPVKGIPTMDRDTRKRVCYVTDRTYARPMESAFVQSRGTLSGGQVTRGYPGVVGRGLT